MVEMNEFRASIEKLHGEKDEHLSAYLLPLFGDVTSNVNGTLHRAKRQYESGSTKSASAQCEGEWLDTLEYSRKI